VRYPAKVLALISPRFSSGLISYGATIGGTVKGSDGAPYEGAFVQAQTPRPT